MIELFSLFTIVTLLCYTQYYTYGSESWTIRKADMLKLEAFEILGVRQLDKVRNLDIRLGLIITKTISEEIVQ